MFPQVPLFKKLLDFSIHLLIPAKGQFVTIKTSQDEFSFGKTVFHSKTTYFTHKEDFFLARYRSLNGPHLLRMVQPIKSPENPGTTVVSIGHLTPWPENPGYPTQVWDKSLKPMNERFSHCFVCHAYRNLCLSVLTFYACRRRCLAVGSVWYVLIFIRW